MDMQERTVPVNGEELVEAMLDLILLLRKVPGLPQDAKLSLDTMKQMIDELNLGPNPAEYFSIGVGRWGNRQERPVVLAADADSRPEGSAVGTKRVSC